MNKMILLFVLSLLTAGCSFGLVVEPRHDGGNWNHLSQSEPGDPGDPDSPGGGDNPPGDPGDPGGPNDNAPGQSDTKGGGKSQGRGADRGSNGKGHTK